MGNNEQWDREEELHKIFDPGNITALMEYSPKEFIAMMVMEIRQEVELINAWTKLLNENPQFRSQSFQFGEKEIEAAFFTEITLRSARMIKRLLDTASAYREQLPEAGDQE